MLAFATNLFLILGLIALATAFFYLIRKKFARAGLCIVAFFVSVGCFSSFGNADARAKGFADLTDMQSAKKAGYFDAAVWAPKKASIEQAKAAAMAVENARFLQAQASKQAEEEADAAAAQASAAAERRAEEAANLRVRASVFAEQMVRSRLKDPASAIIRSARIDADSYGHLVVCGGVNAKNSYGGYTGEKGFVAIPETGSIDIESPTESDNIQFNISWTNNCR